MFYSVAVGPRLSSASQVHSVMKSNISTTLALKLYLLMLNEARIINFILQTVS